MSTMTDQNVQRQNGSTDDTSESIATINADPKWIRRHRVIAALEEYKQRLDARSSLQERYDDLCTKLYSGRSSRITGMPVNHDQLAAGDHFAEMLDEKMELERALAAEADVTDDVRNALEYIDSQSRMILEQFYLDESPRKALSTLMNGLGYSSPHVYELRNAAIDKLYNIMYAEA